MAAAVTTTAAASTAAAAALGLRTGFIHIERAAIEFGAVQLRESGFGIALFRHFDEGEAAGLPCVTIGDDADALNGAVLGERSF